MLDYATPADDADATTEPAPDADLASLMEAAAALAATHDRAVKVSMHGVPAALFTTDAEPRFTSLNLFRSGPDGWFCGSLSYGPHTLECFSDNFPMPWDDEAQS